MNDPRKQLHLLLDNIGETIDGIVFDFRQQQRREELQTPAEKTDGVQIKDRADYARELLRRARVRVDELAREGVTHAAH